MLLLSSPQQPVPISLLDAAVQTTPPCDASQDVSTQTSVQPVSPLSLDVAVQTSFHSVHTSSLDAAVQALPHSTLSQHVSTLMGSRSASSFSVDVFVQTPVRSNVLHDAATQLPLTEFFIGCIYSNDPLDRQNFVCQSPPSAQGPRALLQQPPGLEQPAPPLEFAAYSHLLTTHGASTDSFSPVMLSSRLSVPPMWEHTLHAQLPAPKEVLVPPLREPTILLVLILEQETGPFPIGFSHGQILGNPSLTGLVTLTQLTAISCIINSASPFFSGIQARRRNPTNIVSAACGKFHAVILQEASDHVPHISDQFRAYTDNTDLAS